MAPKLQMLLPLKRIVVHLKPPQLNQLGQRHHLAPKNRKVTSKSLSNEMINIQRQISATGEVIQNMLSTKASDEQPKSNDGLFRHMITSELQSMLDSYEKGLLKLNIQRSIMEAKYGQSTRQPSRKYSSSLDNLFSNSSYNSSYN